MEENIRQRNFQIEPAVFNNKKKNEKFVLVMKWFRVQFGINKHE